MGDNTRQINRETGRVGAGFNSDARLR